MYIVKKSSPERMCSSTLDATRGRTSTTSSNLSPRVNVSSEGEKQKGRDGVSSGYPILPCLWLSSCSLVPKCLWAFTHPPRTPSSALSPLSTDNFTTAALRVSCSHTQPNSVHAHGMVKDQRGLWNLMNHVIQQMFSLQRVADSAKWSVRSGKTLWICENIEFIYLRNY